MGSPSLKKESPGKREVFFWIFLAALALSSFLHLLFLQRAERWVMSGFSAASYDTIVPRTFRMKRVEIDPKTLDETKIAEKKITTPIPVSIENDRPIPELPETKAIPHNLLSQPELPSEEKLDVRTEAKMEKNILPEINLSGHEEASAAALDIPLHSSPITLSEPKGPATTEGSLGGIATRVSGKYSTLDELLSGQGSISSATAPILMPTDLLFEYDSDILKTAATQSLAKLGTLIKKNQQAAFRIEGHTDSFGSEEYNQGLSLRRAEAVKLWLHTTMGIDPTRITTAGLGKSHLLVPATGTVEQQQLNRRVEIVIKNH